MNPVAQSGALCAGEILVSRLPDAHPANEQSTLDESVCIPLADCQVRTLTDCVLGNACLRRSRPSQAASCSVPSVSAVCGPSKLFDCADEVDRFLLADVPVGECLADQLLLPAGAGIGRSLSDQRAFASHLDAKSIRCALFAGRDPIEQKMSAPSHHGFTTLTDGRIEHQSPRADWVVCR